MSKPITLAEFLESERALLRRFEAYWQHEHELRPGHFPKHLRPGDWDEQLTAFGEVHPESTAPAAKAAPTPPSKSKTVTRRR